MRKLATAAGLLGAFLGTTSAQSPEVRRALPVEPSPPAGATPTPVRRAEPVDPEAYRNPGWMDRLPTRRAEPVERPAATPPPPGATPFPIATPPPVEAVRPAATPRAPAGEAPPAATPLPQVAPGATPPTPEAATPGDPALPPAGGDAGQPRSLVAGNGFYRRAMYDMAVFEYEKFLVAEPKSPERAGALFRLAESHRFLGNERAAREAYQRLLAETPEGEFAGSGAYRLGEIFYAEENLPAAADMFARAEQHATSPEVKLSAAFFAANTLQRLGRTAQAAKKFAEIAKAPGENPYRETATFFLAEQAAEAGRKAEALAAYEQLVREGTKPGVKVEATVKAAALAAELGRKDRAKELFQQALALPDLGDWAGVVRLGAMRLAYDEGDYKSVVAVKEEELGKLPGDGLPEALLIMANARRQLGETSKALALYDRILNEHAGSTAASQARFQRLVSLEATGAKDIGKQIDDFLAVSTNPRERAQATLLKAETLFKAGDYAGAAPLYAQVLKSDLPARLLTQARYKLGWSQLQLQQPNEAVQTFTLFIDQNPKSDLLPAALVQRAMGMQQVKAYEGALRDFDRVINNFPKAKEREIALQQKALVLGQLERYDEMAAVFQKLLDEFPKTRGAAQAEYWIGWQAFEKKDYPTALARLRKARELDAKAFGERATLRIVLALYYGQDRAALAEEVAKADMTTLPAEVLAWLGQQFFDEGDFKKAEQFLAPVVARDGGGANPDALLALARARLAQKKFDAAQQPVRDYLAAARDPLSRARGLLASAEVSLGTGNYEDANKLVEEAMLLQPEGRYNAEARLLAGEVLMQRGDFDEAARAFMTISIIYDDPSLTPRALDRAAAAYRKAGNPAEAQKAIAEKEQRYPQAGDGAKPTAAKRDDA